MVPTMASPDRKLTNPKEIGKRGEEIYESKYKQTFEAEHIGKFVAIEIYSQRAFVDETPGQVLEKAQKEMPDGLFHLIKVGSPGAFRLSYTSDADTDWLFR
ncbi:hypothetical protein MYX77_03105 [Acidobacteriia bacterium AH_259_A11_L15]|nr:hypothetical protein [Acidobacteriia bacterium AH_259_A11_L15]